MTYHTTELDPLTGDPLGVPIQNVNGAPQVEPPRQECDALDAVPRVCQRHVWIRDLLSCPGEGPWSVLRSGSLPALVAHTDGRSFGWFPYDREAIAVCAALNALDAE